MISFAGVAAGRHDVGQLPEVRVQQRRMESHLVFLGKQQPVASTPKLRVNVDNSRSPHDGDMHDLMMGIFMTYCSTAHPLLSHRFVASYFTRVNPAINKQWLQLVKRRGGQLV